jgi:hypothetical protein
MRNTNRCAVPGPPETAHAASALAANPFLTNPSTRAVASAGGSTSRRARHRAGVAHLPDERRDRTLGLGPEIRTAVEEGDARSDSGIASDTRLVLADRGSELRAMGLASTATSRLLGCRCGVRASAWADSVQCRSEPLLRAPSGNGLRPRAGGRPRQHCLRLVAPARSRWHQMGSRRDGCVRSHDHVLRLL